MTRTARLPDKLFLVLAIAGAHVPATALADQCAWTDATTAAHARDLVRAYPRAIEHCEPCGTPRGEPFTVAEATLREPAAGFTELALDGKAVDLAYVFVETAPGSYANLAKLAGCETHGVSPAITLAPPPSARAPVACVAITPPASPSPSSSSSPLPLPSSSSPSLVITTITAASSVSGLVAMAWLGGMLAGIAGALGVLVLRRRPSMRPRAADLPPR